MQSKEQRPFNGVPLDVIASLSVKMRQKDFQNNEKCSLLKQKGLCKERARFMTAHQSNFSPEARSKEKREPRSLLEHLKRGTDQHAGEVEIRTAQGIITSPSISQASPLRQDQTSSSKINKFLICKRSIAPPPLSGETIMKESYMPTIPRQVIPQQSIEVSIGGFGDCSLETLTNLHFELSKHLKEEARGELQVLNANDIEEVSFTSRQPLFNGSQSIIRPPHFSGHNFADSLDMVSQPPRKILKHLNTELNEIKKLSMPKYLNSNQNNCFL
jgi:hypothetical protein